MYSFLLHKRIIKIMMEVGPTYSCKGLSRKFRILRVPCLYIFSMMTFVFNKREDFHTNLLLHGINMRHKNQLRRPTINLIHTQKDVTYPCIRIFNSLPSNNRNCKQWNL
jgi:hypothetical protein